MASSTQPELPQSPSCQTISASSQNGTLMTPYNNSHFRCLLLFALGSTDAVCTVFALTLPIRWTKSYTHPIHLQRTRIKPLNLVRNAQVKSVLRDFLPSVSTLPKWKLMRVASQCELTLKSKKVCVVTRRRRLLSDVPAHRASLDDVPGPLCVVHGHTNKHTNTHTRRWQLTGVA